MVLRSAAANSRNFSNKSCRIVDANETIAQRLTDPAQADATLDELSNWGERAPVLGDPRA